jgi:uncharacterized small protein (DUF1192 family)
MRMKSRIYHENLSYVLLALEWADPTLHGLGPVPIGFPQLQQVTLDHNTEHARAQARADALRAQTAEARVGAMQHEIERMGAQVAAAAAEAECQRNRSNSIAENPHKTSERMARMLAQKTRGTAWSFLAPLT